MSAEGRPLPEAAATPAALALGSMLGSAPVLSILVISYNTRAMTLDCLRTVVAETRTPYELIVLDNASADGSAEAIAAEFPEVRLIASPENLGFAEGNNVAARVARGEYLLLLNPDTLVLRGALDKLLGFARAEPQAGIWGGRTLFADGSLNPSSCWRRLDLWALAMRASGLAGLFRDSPVFNAEAYGGWRRDSPREVDIVTGCLFLIRRETWDRLGGFDPTFVMYGDEADLCRRAQAIGAPADDHPRGRDRALRRRLGDRARRQAGAALPGADDADPPALPALAAAARPRAAARDAAHPGAGAPRPARGPCRRAGRPGASSGRAGPSGATATRTGPDRPAAPGLRPGEPRRGGGPRGTA